MSRDYAKICKSICESNERLHSGEHSILKDIENIKRDIKMISKKLDQISNAVVRLINNTE
jgi:hypothetical protein